MTATSVIVAPRGDGDATTGLRALGPGSCPDEDCVISFLERELPPARAAAVEAHLDACPSCRRLVAVLAQEGSETPLVRMGLLPCGERIAQFEIEGLIGRGGMGDVYAARDTTLRRRVAIKLINAGLSDSPEARARVLVEARAMARLSHPNIASIYSAGEYEGQPYLALEHLSGTTLRHRLDQGPLPASEAIEIARGIASALAEAHAHGVLHRDLKPQNVMLPRDGRARVLDFGLAKVRREAFDVRGESVFETQDPAIRGTPAYIAPEQWRGERSAEPADIWALGVILYEMVSRRRPYQEENAIGYALKVAEVNPVPAPSPSPGTPERLVELIARCLDKDAARRPTAAELARRLESIGAGEALRVAAELERAAAAWMNHGETERDLWDGLALERAERALSDSAVSLAAPATRFLTASVERARRRAKRRSQALVLLGAAASIAAVVAAVMAASSHRHAERAERGEERATKQRASALIEGASAAFARGEHLEAKAKLRQGLELGDSAAGRALWSTLEREPLLWTRTLGSGVFDVQLSPSGAEFAAGGQDRTVYVVDLATLRARSLRGHRDQVYKVAYAPSGRWIASSSWSGELRLWSLPDGGSRVLTASGPRAAAMVFEPGGERLFVAAVEGPIRAIDVNGGDARVLSESAARDLTLDAEGALWAAGVDGHVRRFDRTTGALLADLAVSPVPASAIAVARESGAIAIGGDDGRIRVIDRAAMLLQTLEGHRSKIVRVRAALAGRWVSIAEDKSARLWAPDGTSLALGDPDRALWGLDVDAKGETAVVAGLDGKVRRWDLTKRAAAPAGGAHADGATSLAFGDGVLYSGGYDRAIRSWDLADGTPLGALLGHQGTIYGLARSGEFLASASHDGTVRLWRVPAGVELALLSGHRGGVYALAFDPSGKSLATAGSDGTVRRWTLPAGTAVAVRRTPSPLFALAWSPRGDLLASAGADKTIEIADTKGRVTATLVGHVASVWGLAFHPEGHELASASHDGTLRLWDLATKRGRVVARLEARAYSVAFLPDGERVAVSSADGRARVFSLSTGAPLELSGHRAEVNQVRVDPTGRLAATASDDGTVRVWDLETGWQVWRSSADARLRDTRGRWTCKATLGGEVELWEGDVRVSRSVAQGASSIVALEGGCLSLEGGAARLYDRAGTARDLAPLASAIAADGDGRAWVSTDERLLAFDVAGGKVDERPGERGVTALLPLSDGRVALGYSNGLIELSGASASTLESTSAAGAVTRLVEGPMRTIAAGWESGALGVFSLDNGARLIRAALHGPIVALSSDGGVFEATSEVGQRLAPIDVLSRDYCALLRQLWAEVPVVWRDGLPVVLAPPGGHRCS
jgi:WD40 repeat protein/serine/threonine protein kinase